jgi:hypothetical protein
MKMRRFLLTTMCMTAAFAVTAAAQPVPAAQVTVKGADGITLGATYSAAAAPSTRADESARSGQAPSTRADESTRSGQWHRDVRRGQAAAAADSRLVRRAPPQREHDGRARGCAVEADSSGGVLDAAHEPRRARQGVSTVRRRATPQSKDAALATDKTLPEEFRGPLRESIERKIKELK